MPPGRPKKIIHPPIETVSESMQTQPISTVADAINNNDLEIFNEPLKEGSKITYNGQEHIAGKTVSMFDPIYQKYLQKLNEPSDINELLPYIFEVATLCEHCTEFGVRQPTSTYAFLAAKPKRLVSYDLGRYDEEVTEVETLCAEVGQDFKFIQANVLEVEIEQTDFLLIDTYHTFTHLTHELRLHANKVNKFIAFHDTQTHRYLAQDWYPGIPDHMNCNQGIFPAIENFLRDNPDWKIYQEFDFNNGMIIIKKGE